MFFEVAFLSGNYVPDSGTAQQSGRSAEGNRKSKNNWNRNDCCNETISGTFFIQHAVYNYTSGGVCVNIFCNDAGCQVHSSGFPNEIGFIGSDNLLKWLSIET